MSIRPRLAGIVCAIGACLAVVSPVGAQEDTKRACASAFSSAQRLMRTGSLIEARKKLVLCGGPECPEVMHPDCQQWLTSVEASLPTVVFQVSSAAGVPLASVRVSLDGAEVIPVDGRAWPIDPGEHEAVFESVGFRTSSRHIVVSEGEKLRREVVVLDSVPPPKVAAELPAKRLATANPPANPPASRRLTLPIVVAASSAVLAGAGAIYLGLGARGDERDLDSCRPGCTREEVDHVKREYLLANVSIGLAAAGATTAVLLFLLQGKTSTPPTATLGLNVGPDRLGLGATGRF